VVTYVQWDCYRKTLTIGDYTTDYGKLPVAIINLESYQHITRIELYAKEKGMAHMTICTSDDECFGPFGRFTEVEPDTIFEEPGGIIHSFYGWAGGGVDSFGVYYENPPSSPPCEVSNTTTYSHNSHYSQSFMAPNRTKNFDHFELFGFTPSDKSQIHKISEIKVYYTDICFPNSNCSLVTGHGIILGLSVTYIQRDCTPFTIAIGEFTDADRTLVTIIILQRDQHITRIELYAEERGVAHMTICTSDDECFGPFGRFTEVEPDTIFEEPGGVIHSFYGWAGYGLDNFGVYYENPPSSMPC
jgi:hypothetical protein